MCKIRVIIKTVDSEILYDEVHEIVTTVNPLDRPTYVEMVNQGRKVLTFFYTGSQEKYVTKNLNEDISITYGEVSGRISQYTTHHNRVEGTDTYAITNRLLEQCPSLRFENNIREGLKLVDSLIKLFVSLSNENGMLKH